MKQITYRVNTKTGYITLVNGKDQPSIQEYESNAVRLVFEFNRPIRPEDKLFIQITNGKFTKPYRLIRANSNQYYFDIPREALKRGRLVFTIHHYDPELINCQKYSPDTYLYITAAGDITNDMLDSRPDLFAELVWRIEELEKRLEKIEAREN